MFHPGQAVTTSDQVIRANTAGNALNIDGSTIALEKLSMPFGAVFTPAQGVAPITAIRSALPNGPVAAVVGGSTILPGEVRKINGHMLSLEHWLKWSDF